MSTQLTADSKFPEYRDTINEIIDTSVNLTVVVSGTPSATEGFSDGHVWIENGTIKTVYILVADIWVLLFHSDSATFLSTVNAMSIDDLNIALATKLDEDDFNTTNILERIREVGLEIDDINGLQAALDEKVNDSDFTPNDVLGLVLQSGNLQITDIDGLQAALSSRVLDSEFTPANILNLVRSSGIDQNDIEGLPTALANRVETTEFTPVNLKALLLQEGIGTDDITGLQDALDNAGSVRLEDFPSSFTTSGYQQLPKGLIIQWFRANDPLPIPFPNNEFIRLESNFNSPTQNLPAIAIGN